MRDYYIIAGCHRPGHPERLRVKALITAIAEYELSQQCIHKYYQLVNNKVVPIIQGTAEEINAKYAKERALHWGMFWQLTMLNIED